MKFEGTYMMCHILIGFWGCIQVSIEHYHSRWHWKVTVAKNDKAGENYGETQNVFPQENRESGWSTI